MQLTVDALINQLSQLPPGTLVMTLDPEHNLPCLAAVSLELHEVQLSEAVAIMDCYKMAGASVALLTVSMHKASELFTSNTKC